MQSSQNSVVDNRITNPLKRSLFISYSKDPNTKTKKIVHLNPDQDVNHSNFINKPTPCKSQTFSQITISSTSEKNIYLQKSHIVQKPLSNVFNSNQKQNLVQNLFEKIGTNKKQEKPSQNIQFNQIKKNFEFSQNHKLLIKIQGKLDETLSFLKQNRHKNKGQFFSIIKKIILQSNNISIQSQHLKKIMFIDDLYIIKKQKVQNENNFLICMKGGKGSLQERRQNFKNKLQIFIQKNRGEISQNQSPDVEIPQIKLSFEKENFYKSQDQKKQIVKFIILPEGKPGDKMWIFKKKSLQEKKQLQQNLKKKILKKEQLIRKQRQFKNLNGCKDNLMKKDIYRIIEEIQLVFLTKNKNNILLKELVEYVGSILLISNQIIQKIVEKLLSICNKNNCCFLKEIVHKQERVIQIDKNLINQMKNCIQDKEEIVLQLINPQEVSIKNQLMKNGQNK